MQPGAGRHHRGASCADVGDDLLGIDSLEEIEHLPTERVDISDQSDLTRVDDWIALATLAREHTPKMLAAFGFPERQAEVLQRLASPSRELLVSVLRRLADLALSTPPAPDQPPSALMHERRAAVRTEPSPTQPHFRRASSNSRRAAERPPVRRGARGPSPSRSVGKRTPGAERLHPVSNRLSEGCQRRKRCAATPLNQAPCARRYVQCRRHAVLDSGLGDARVMQPIRPRIEKPCKCRAFP